jgi:hypothetical protein
MCCRAQHGGAKAPLGETDIPPRITVVVGQKQMIGVAETLHVHRCRTDATEYRCEFVGV